MAFFPFEKLYEDAQREILQYLDLSTLGNCCVVNHHMNALVETLPKWKRIAEEELLNGFAVQPHKEDVNWFKFCKRFHSYLQFSSTSKSTPVRFGMLPFFTYHTVPNFGRFPPHLITNQLSRHHALSISMWFRSKEQGGGLIGLQNQPFPTGEAFVPLLYVGDHGKLLGGFWSQEMGGNFQLESPSTVNENQWHHVVLVGKKDEGEWLYLDGEEIGHKEGHIDLESDQLEFGQIGSVMSDRWPHAPMDYRRNCFNFEGEIAECKLWKIPLNLSQIRKEMWDSLTDTKEKKDFLLAEWTFQKRRTKVEDESGQGNDLELEGPKWHSIFHTQHPPSTS